MSTTAQVRRVTDANFEADVLRAQGVVVARFGAEWCAPCKMLAPHWEGLASSRGSEARFVDVDADASPGAMSRHGIRGLPTVLYFRDGALIGRVVGAVPRQRLEAELERVLKV